MKRFIFTKSQLDKLRIHENRSLLREADFNTVSSTAQEDDVLYLKRDTQDNKKFKIKEVRDGNLFAVDMNKNVRVEIPKTGLDETNHSLTYIMVQTQKGTKSRTTITIGDITDVFLLRDGDVIEQIDVSEPSDAEEEKKEKKTKKKVEERKQNIIAQIKELKEGDIVHLTKGELNKEGELDKSTSTDIKFKVVEKRDDTEAILRLEDTSGTESSSYQKLGEYDKIILNDWSIKVNSKNPDKLDVSLNVVEGESTNVFPIPDVVVFDTYTEGGSDEEESSEATILSKKEIERIKNHPKVEKAMRLGMELDDIINKLDANKKGRKLKSKSKFVDKARLSFKWLSEPVGEGPYKLGRNQKKIGKYNKTKNRIKSTISQSQTGGKGSISIFLEDLQKTNKEDIYQVKVRAQVEQGNDIKELFDEYKVGKIKIIDYNISG